MQQENNLKSQLASLRGSPRIGEGYKQGYWNSKKSKKSFETLGG